MKKAIGTALAALVAITMVLVSPAQAYVSGGEDGHTSRNGWCASFTVPVAPAQGQPRSWKVGATYCQPFRRPREVDVLTHGSTYTRSYWDWPQDPATYSYVDKTLADGRAVLTYDRIGNGASTRPPSTEITMASDAFVLHQLVVGLRFLGFRHINSVSHSYGSGVALAEATTDYGDSIKVSALVLTGYLHRPSNPAVTAGNYPANLDPKFAGLGLDGGYLTTRPGTRGAGFHAPTSDPAVVAYDEDHKDVVSLTGLLQFLSARGVPAGDNISNLVTMPVLVVNGQQDAIFCYQPLVFDCSNAAVVTANEAPFYTNSPSFTVVTVPESGHDLTLHRSAQDSFDIISGWLASH